MPVKEITTMATPNLEAARRHHDALKQFFISCASREVPDLRALRRVLTLCDAASAAADDAYCREKLRLVSEYAAEMLGRSDHARWSCDAMSGREFLRQQVLNALELLASRLYSLEALRRTRGENGARIWITRSSIAQL
jgi:hypothetical protein